MQDFTNYLGDYFQGFVLGMRKKREKRNREKKR